MEGRLASSVRGEHATLDLGVIVSSATLVVAFTLKKKKT